MALLVQPQSLPLEMTSSRHSTPADIPRAPTKSNRPWVLSPTGDSGITFQMTSRVSTASPAAPQNNTCQFTCWAMIADRGTPRAPPMPSEELISPRAEPSFSGGSSSRITLIPSGIRPVARPCSARPTTTGNSALLSAQTTEPMISSTRLTIIIRFLPYMSPRRPTIGVEIAAPSRVAVTTQAVFEAEECSSSGRSEISGTTRVCMTETTTPAAARAPIISPGPGAPSCRLVGSADACAMGASGWMTARSTDGR